MASKLRLFTLLSLALLIFSACAELEKEPATAGIVPSEEIETDPIQAEIDAFFKQYIDTDVRPVAVMVDNDNDDARPHAGLNEAYLIYEMMIEGGSTRFMALYRGEDVEKIGPVRSSRHYFLDYVMENDAIYTHYGWSPKAMSDISAFKINKINGVLGGDDSIFWREKKHKNDWHSAYTSIVNINSKAAEKKYKDTTDRKNGLCYSDSYIDLAEGTSAKNVLLPYSYRYNTGYSYNEETKLYEKSIDGEPHVMQSGDVLTVKNIIIELIYDTSLGDGSDRRNINTTGSGKGYYITNGACEEITWSKPSRKENTIYKKADGTPLLINPGKTIVNIISPSASIIIE